MPFPRPTLVPRSYVNVKKTECQKDLLGVACGCVSCKPRPRSKKQIASDNKQRYRSAKRARMEELPEFVDDLRNEVNLDPFIDSIAPDPLIDEIGGYHEHTPPMRGDYVNNPSVFPNERIEKVGDKHYTWKAPKVASQGVYHEPKHKDKSK